MDRRRAVASDACDVRHRTRRSGDGGSTQAVLVCSQAWEKLNRPGWSGQRYMGDKGYERRYDIGLEVLKELPYHSGRDASPEDTLRFQRCALAKWQVDATEDRRAGPTRSNSAASRDSEAQGLCDERCRDCGSPSA
jgi:hypothetical protein